MAVVVSLGGLVGERYCGAWLGSYGKSCFGSYGTLRPDMAVKVRQCKVGRVQARFGSHGKSRQGKLRCVEVSSGKHVNDNNERRQYGGI